MKFLLILIAFLGVVLCSSAQINNQTFEDQYFRKIEGSKNSNSYRIELTSDIDTTWSQWKQKAYHFGFDPGLTPMHTIIDGIITTPYMLQVRGNANEDNKKRWGYHVFEGYAKDDKSRITMLVNKHIEEEKPVAEMYYYSPLWGHSNAAYNWFRIGSDVRQHSFLFSRDLAIFYGSLKLTNTLTLGAINSDNIRRVPPDGDDEQNYQESAKHVNFKALQQAEDGSIFYDEDHHLVVIKINGEWMRLKVESLPDGVKYDF